MPWGMSRSIGTVSPPVIRKPPTRSVRWTQRRIAWYVLDHRAKKSLGLVARSKIFLRWQSHDGLHDLGLNLSALVDVDVKDRPVARDVDVGQLAFEVRIGDERRAP